MPKTLLGLIGHPLGHSLSPQMHNEQFRRLGLDGYYHLFDTPTEELQESVQALRQLGTAGFNITIPYKVSVMAYIDRVDSSAERIGAVNTVVRENEELVGYNTDGEGYLESLLAVRSLEQIKNANILVIGAGGAARAVCYALSLRRPNNIILVNRTQEKAEQLKSHLEDIASIEVVPKEEAESRNSEYDILINTTSIGMSPETDRSPWPLKNVKTSALCSDLIYNPWETRWLKEARKAGLDTLNGSGMFVNQGALAFKYWTGQEPDRKAMHSLVENHLKGEHNAE
ncbi:shikimate dehydrogenase [Marinococcus halophilus]|uniref:Shikimate dehydrogenase (NADP(+)) n=1 Tax=Marinococcus halophilus TaxID=1371 RepID=A0A510Y607_MARHA|nr:shikimate dehydrogenase [Marinococcus halophilus]OZT81063.1 shikimate dehydrogenase [Marinococcus halophilus]GEK58774.1 shikimate dehydrogenase (NADP(+)) [Marinococcus halophilus]